MQSTELRKIGYIRALAEHLREGAPILTFPHFHAMSPYDVYYGIAFARGDYPWPEKWTRRIFFGIIRTLPPSAARSHNALTYRERNLNP